MDNTTVVTAKYGTIITATGLAKITAAILHGTKINITHAAVGDSGGVYYKPTPEQTDLRHECWRGEIAYARINSTNPKMFDVKFIVPAEVGGFTVREAKLVDQDGDTIAICNTPDAEKVSITDGVSFPLAIMMHIVVMDASAVSFTINPSLDVVCREEMEKAFKEHNEDPDAHPDIPRFYIGTKEPEKGPAFWFDTTVPPEPAEEPEVIMLDIGPMEDDTAVSVEIDGKQYAVRNAGVTITPEDGSYAVDITPSANT